MQPSLTASPVRFSMPTSAPKPSTHYASGFGGFLEHLLPTIGSVGGMALGTVLAPGLGTAAGGAGGAVLGQKIQDMLTGGHTSTAGYLGQAALGSLGGVGKAVKAVGAAGSAIRAGEGAATAGKALRFGSEGASAVTGMQGLSAADKTIVANEANAGQAGVRDLVAGKAAKAGQSALLSQTGGLSRQTATSAIRDVGKMQDLGYTSVDKMAAHAPAVTGPEGALTQTRTALLQKAAPIDATSFKDIVANHLDKNVALKPAETKNINNLMDKIANKYTFEGTGEGIGNTPALNVDLARREIADAAYAAKPASAARNTLLGISNEMRAPIEQSMTKVPFDDTTKSALVKSLQSKGVNNPKLLTAIKNSQTASDLSAIESPFVTASQMAKEGAESSLRAGAKTFDQSAKKITGMANEAVGTVVGTPIKKITAGLTNRVASLVKPSEAAAPSTLPGVAASAAKGGLKAQIVPRLLTGGFNNPQPQTDQVPVTQPTDTSSLGTGGVATIPSGDTSQPNQTEQLKNGLMAAMVADLQTGGKNVSALNTIYGLLDKQQTMTPALQTRHDNLNSAISSLDAAEQMLITAGGAKGAVVGQLAKVPLFGQYLNNSGVAYEKAKTDTAAQLAKAVTGGSRVNESVFRGFMNSLPDITDTPKQAASKLENLRMQMNAQANQFGFTDITGGQ